MKEALKLTIFVIGVIIFIALLTLVLVGIPIGIFTLAINFLIKWNLTN